VAYGIILKRISELDVIDVAATHRIKLAVTWEKHPNQPRSSLRHVRPCRPIAGRGRWRWGWCCAGAYEIEFADACVPVAALGILVDMPEVRAIGGIDFRPGIITPPGAASLRADSRKHDAFSLHKVVWRISAETSRVPNRREDCRARGGIAYARAPCVIEGDAGHRGVHPPPAISPRLLLNRSHGEGATGHIKLIPANTCWLGAV